jgi:hypothetical protein
MEDRKSVPVDSPVGLKDPIVPTDSHSYTPELFITTAVRTSNPIKTVLYNTQGHHTLVMIYIFDILFRSCNKIHGSITVRPQVTGCESKTNSLHLLNGFINAIHEFLQVHL